MNFDWLTFENVSHVIAIAAMLGPVIPAKVLTYLGIFGKMIEYAGMNFGAAKNQKEK